jgi:hypothetical protein
MEQEKFDLWCAIELFGHTKIAGRCTEQNIAGVNMLRVDVPATNGQPEFTRFLSAGAIYAINPVSEEIARKIAENLEIAPVSVYEIIGLTNEKPKALQNANSDDDDGYSNPYDKE